MLRARTLAPLVLIMAAATACHGSASSSSPGDSTILGASPGFEIRTVYARYAPGVPFGPQLPKQLVQEMSSQHCPMRPRIVQGLLMECDTGKTVYLLRNPLVQGDIASATARQIPGKDIWYVEIKLDPQVSRQLTGELKSMVGEQLAFSYGGAVLTSLVVDSSFHPGHFAITGDYDRQSATSLARHLTG